VIFSHLFPPRSHKEGTRDDHSTNTFYLFVALEKAQKQTLERPG
jgi:hypothetical protein